MDQRHINEAELQEIWFSGTTASAEQESARQDMLMHCGECPACSDLLDNYLQAEPEIDSLLQRDKADSKSAGMCPQDEMWLKLAADVLDRDDAIRLAIHAGSCSMCARALRVAQQNLVEDTAEDPERESVSAEWQAKMAHEMSLGSSFAEKSVRATRGRKHHSWVFWVPPAAVVASAVAVALIWLLPRTGPQDVRTLLGRAYSESRTLELRFAYATYGPLRIERGTSQSQTSKPPTLLEAEESLSRHLRTTPDDPVWLDLKARADLLDGNYDAALKSLQEALRLQPDSVEILTDTATACFAVAEIEDRPQGYGRAIDLLGQALTKRPDDPVALYNRALISEKMFLYGQAIDDWQHYLKVDGHGEWSEEATRRLDLLRKKMADHERSAAEPLLPAADFAEDAGVQHPEQYLDKAIQEWLPMAFPAPTRPSGGIGTGNKSLPAHAHSSSSSRTVLASLRILAGSLIVKHNDHWLSDLIDASQSNVFPGALRILRQAVQANLAGDFATGKIQSEAAAKLFRQAGNMAGEMRSRYETIYSLERSFQAKDRCLLEVAILASKPKYRQYSWLQVQLSLERSNCWAQIGDFGQAYRFADDALATAQASGYAILQLRAVGMVAALDSRQGNTEKAYALDRAGLTHYWNGPFPSIRAYQFYSDLGVLAEEKNEWNFALALAQEAVTAITRSNQPLGEAFAHHRLAKVALMAGDSALAGQEFDRANRLFSALPQTKETWAYQADAEVELAKLQAAHGDADGAWAHLRLAGSHISRVSHYSVAFSYYKALADLQRLSHNSSEVLQALRSAVAVAERGLRSLRNEDERLLWARETGEVYRDLAEFSWRTGSQEAAFKIWEEYRGATIRSSGRPQQQDSHTVLSKGFPGSFPAPAGQTMVSFMQAHGGLIVWVYDRHGIISRWIDAPERKLIGLADRFRAECADRNSNLNSLRQHGRDLYDLLIAPIADQLPPKSILVIEPDDSVSRIPLAALVDSAGNYFGEDFTVEVSPGLLYRGRLHHSQGLSRADRALVIGPPAQDYRLPGTLALIDEAEQEARYVAAKFRSTALFLGSQATQDRVLRELPRASIFHYAGHGVSFRGKASLLLAPLNRGSVGPMPLLDTASLTSLRLDRLKLVVLSACSTAGGGENNLTDPGNLVRLFLRSGVPNVVASQWSVDSATTIDFMKAFYDLLLAGGSVPTSLQTAARRLQHSPSTSHPYFWAAFTTFGT